MNANTKTHIKKGVSALLVGLFAINSLSPFKSSEAGSTEVVYPLKEVAKLECRFNDFDTLGNDCIENLPILKSSDYQKYATYNQGYNDFTRRYTVLWGSSYTYGWDIGNGGHMGVDIATAKGTPVYSMSNGTVIVASDLGSLGNTVAIKHDFGGKTIISSYSHMSKIEVNVGDTVGVGRKIGEVGSTGNSTGNHLHFQIDTSTKSTPAYYDYATCPYSYTKIVEEGACFGELQKMTIDPLLFLETSGAVLNSMPSYNNNSGNNNSQNNNSQSNNSGNSNSSNSYNDVIGVDMGVFDRTVNTGSNKDDIRSVQNILSNLGYYKGAISGDYNDVYESVIDYQVATGVIATRTSDGAGNFGPSTRKQAKKDFENFLNSEIDMVDTSFTGTQNNNNNGTPNYDNQTNDTYYNDLANQVTIRKEELLTREQIEAMEVEDFMEGYNLDLKFRNVTGNIELGGKEIIDLTVTDKKKGKPFVGNMPGGMTFILNNEKVDIFPTKLFNFTNGKREIEVTGLQEGTTKLQVKVGTVTVATFDIVIYNGERTIYPETAQLVAPASVVLGGSQTAITFFRDVDKNLLVNIPFGSTFRLEASEGNKVCIKRGTMNNVKKVVATPCRDEEYKQSIDFTYEDTISGILIYDYKAFNNNATYRIVNTYNGTELSNKKVVMTLPKGIDNNYEYKNNVITLLEKGVISGVRSGYFEQNKALNEADAYSWIKNSLQELENLSTSSLTKNRITNNINEVSSLKDRASTTKTISRKEFLALTYKYLILENKDVEVTMNYKDLTEAENKLANHIFNANTTWKDDFGHTYFQPDEKITRGETAYVLQTLLNNYNDSVLTLK